MCTTTLKLGALDCVVLCTVVVQLLTSEQEDIGLSVHGSPQYESFIFTVELWNDVKAGNYSIWALGEH